MISARRIAPLLQRAKEQQTAAAQQLAEHQRLLASQQAHLDELSRYAAGERHCASGFSTCAAQLHGQRAFVGRVMEAIGQQHVTIQHRRDCLEHGRSQWLAARRNTQVFEHLSARSHAAERAIEARREQRSLDELGTRTQAHLT